MDNTEIETMAHFLTLALEQEGNQKEKIGNELETFQERLVEGISYILQKVNVSHEFEQLIHFAQELAKKEAQENYISNLMQQRSIQEQCGISNEALEEMYKAAKELYDQGNFLTSRAVFTFLTLLNSFRYAFWLGLANSEYHLQAFDSAVLAYAFAIEIKPSDPISYIYSSRCYEELQELDNAINALDLALLVIDQNNSYSKWKQIIQEEKVRLNRLLGK